MTAATVTRRNALERCSLPHLRIREAGEIYTLTNGARVAARGGERVTDYEMWVDAHAPGALLCAGHSRWWGELIEATPDVFVKIRGAVCNPVCVHEETFNPNKFRPAAPGDVGAMDAADAEYVNLYRWARYLDTYVPPPRMVWRVRGEVAGVLGADPAPVLHLVDWVLSRRKSFEAAPWCGDMLHSIAQAREQHVDRYRLD